MIENKKVGVLEFSNDRHFEKGIADAGQFVEIVKVAIVLISCQFLNDLVFRAKVTIRFWDTMVMKKSAFKLRRCLDVKMISPRRIAMECYRNYGNGIADEVNDRKTNE